MNDESGPTQVPNANANTTRIKILATIVDHLREYPFLLISMAGLIVLTIVLAFDPEKLKELKLLLYGVILIPVVMQFYFEAQKQRAKHRSEQLQQAPAVGVTPVPDPQTVAVNNSKYSGKAIAGFILVILAYNEIGDTPDAELVNVAMGGIVLGIVTLWLGMSAHRDVKNNRASGKGLAIAVIGLSALLVLGSLGWLADSPEF